MNFPGWSGKMTSSSEALNYFFKAKSGIFFFFFFLFLWVFCINFHLYLEKEYFFVQCLKFLLQMSKFKAGIHGSPERNFRSNGHPGGTRHK